MTRSALPPSPDTKPRHREPSASWDRCDPASAPAESRRAGSHARRSASAPRPAERRWNPDRPARIRPRRHRHQIRAPTAAPDPPLDPPGIRSRSHGFRTAPKCGFVRRDPVRQLVQARSCRPSPRPRHSTSPPPPHPAPERNPRKFSIPRSCERRASSPGPYARSELPCSGPRSTPLRQFRVHDRGPRPRRFLGHRDKRIQFRIPWLRSPSTTHPASSTDEIFLARNAAAASRIVIRHPPAPSKHSAPGGIDARSGRNAASSASSTGATFSISAAGISGSSALESFPIRHLI